MWSSRENGQPKESAVCGESLRKRDGRAAGARRARKLSVCAAPLRDTGGGRQTCLSSAWLLFWRLHRHGGGSKGDKIPLRCLEDGKELPRARTCHRTECCQSSFVPGLGTWEDFAILHYYLPLPARLLSLGVCSGQRSPPGEQAGKAVVLFSCSFIRTCHWSCARSYGRSPASLSSCSLLTRSA